MNYACMVETFLDTIELKQDETKKRYAKMLFESIALLEGNNFERPDTEFFSALETHFSGNLAKSTANNRLSITRRFFKWVLEQQKGEEHLPLTNTEPFTETISDIDDRTPCLNFEHEEVETVQAAEESVEAQTVPPVLPSVEATDAMIEQPAHPHEEQTPSLPEQTHTTGRPRKSEQKRNKKFSIYLTQTLFDDVVDLARIQRLSTPDYIFRLIEREAERRADALATFRALEENN